MEILVISPKRAHRARIMLSLVETLEGVKGVKVLGKGPTNVKIQVDSQDDFRKSFDKDISEVCFIESANTFILSKEN